MKKALCGLIFDIIMAMSEKRTGGTDESHCWKREKTDLKNSGGDGDPADDRPDQGNPV